MRQIVKETIDGNEYEFLELGARQSFKLLNRILKTTGPAFAQIASGFQTKDLKSILDAEVNMDVVGKGISLLAQNIDEQYNEETASILLSSVNYKGRPASWESEPFQGNMLHFLKVLRRAAEVNVGDFFGGLKGSAASAARATDPVRLTSLKSGPSGV